MTITNINLNSFSYEIFIGENILGKITDFTHNYDKILLLTNTTVGKIYSDSILNNLPNEKTLTFEIPDGEEYKSFETSMEIFTFLIKNNFSRKSLIICMGGGVVCDLGGFVASNFMRGIDFLQVPTSLLAQVDASIGGKVAINHPLGKNLIGAFKQPIGVIIDTNFLRTLSIEEFYSGMGEVIKHGILNDTQNYLHFLEENHENILNLNPETLEKMISISCNIKKEFVEKDEFENGERAFLNLGHTYAHALESIFNYKNISHGKAVSKGIIFEMYIAKELGYITQEYIDRFLKIFNLLKIDSHPIYFKDKTLLNAMKKDKKNSYENINFILFTGDKFETISVDPKIICKVNSLFKDRILKGVIDIGTNSCRLFIAEIEKKDNNISIVTPLYKDLEVSRLGKNLNQTGVLSEESIKKTFSIIKKFKVKTKSMGVSELVAFATSATREANNGIQFVQSLKSEFDLNTIVIPGEIEAKMSFNGNSSIYSGKIATIDVGGGSSEITIGD
nr:3-dehydroquinate synthase [uncultured Cetobacterium sp.]